MASPGQKRGSCGHVMALFDSHLKCARCRDKGIGDDPCVKKKQCQICDNLSEQQKLQLATPTYRVRKELQKKSSSPSHSVELIIRKMTVFNTLGFIAQIIYEKKNLTIYIVWPASLFKGFHKSMPL